MNILITGGTGFIGQHLIRSLLLDEHTLFCLSRVRQKVHRCFGERVTGIENLEALDDQSIHAVINLAGANIADRRWSEARKRKLVSSRVDTTRHLVNWLKNRQQKPDVLISGSAIGYYGAQAITTTLDEEGSPQHDFTHQLCAAWEQEALNAEADKIRVCLIRTGIVIGQGGALKKMLPAFKLGLGGPIGSGQQWMSWIHMDDEVAAIKHLLHNQTLRGAFNLTSPEAVPNRTFARDLGHVLHRPAVLPLPSFVPKLLLGEGATLLLDGQRVYPARLLKSGFQFQYPQLQEAFNASLHPST